MGSANAAGRQDTNYTKSVELLKLDGIAVPKHVGASLSRYADLIRAWNRGASLVSSGDLDEIDRVHFPDALSLAKYVAGAWGGEGLLLDIGSGAGLPAIPLKMVLPRIPMMLVERSGRKVAFLRKAVAHLGLEGVTIVQANFPEGFATCQPRVITARAVERPGRLVRQTLSLMPVGSTYLCQSAVRLAIPEGFHVERICDAWTRTGLRRGELRVISRPPL